MTDRELMQQALDALGLVTDLTTHDDVLYEAIDALRARLAQPEPEELGEIIPADEEQLKRIAKLIEPEPVAWMHIQGSYEEPCFRELIEDEISRGWTQKPLYYTAPPQREWQGLTDAELWRIGFELGEKIPDLMIDLDFARAIEAKLKEKNND